MKDIYKTIIKKLNKIFLTGTALALISCSSGFKEEVYTIGESKIYVPKKLKCEFFSDAPNIITEIQTDGDTISYYLGEQFNRLEKLKINDDYSASYYNPKTFEKGKSRIDSLLKEIKLIDQKTYEKEDNDLMKKLYN